MRVVAMFRVSTEAQANEGASLDAQQRLYRERAAREGWTTLAEFRGCESAMKVTADREVLQSVLRAIRDLQPDAIYVHEQSRLTRGDELEVALLLRELRERGLKIIISGAVRDLSSIDERFMVGIQSLVDRTEAERIRERSNRGKREKALQGKKCNGPTAYGYRNPPAGDPSRGVLQVVEGEAVVVRRIYEMTNRGVGMRTVCTALNAEQIPSPSGRTWAKSAINRIITNPVYIGTHISNAWVLVNPETRTFKFMPENPRAIVVENAHEAIVSREVWAKVHSRPKPARSARPHLLTKLLWLNGARARGDRTHGKRYYCAHGQGHGYPWLEVDHVNETVWEALIEAVTRPELLEALLAEAGADDRRGELEDRLRRSEAAAAKLRARIDRLVEMRADGEVTREVFVVKSAETRGALKAAESAAGDARAQLAVSGPDAVRRVIGATRALVSDRDRLSEGERREILHSVAQRIEVRAARGDLAHRRSKRGRFDGFSGDAWKIQSVTFDLTASPPNGDNHLYTTPSCSIHPPSRRPPGSWWVQCTTPPLSLNSYCPYRLTTSSRSTGTRGAKSILCATSTVSYGAPSASIARMNR